MEASRPPLKRNRNKGNVQMSKKYQHLNWPNALTKNENSNDSETGIFIMEFSLKLKSVILTVASTIFRLRIACP